MSALLVTTEQPARQGAKPIVVLIGERLNDADARGNATRRAGRFFEMALSKGSRVDSATCFAFFLAISKNRSGADVKIYSNRASVDNLEINSGHRPHLFQIVVLARFRAENVDDDVTPIDEHPVGTVFAFDHHRVDTGSFQGIYYPICKRA